MFLTIFGFNKPQLIAFDTQNELIELTFYRIPSILINLLVLLQILDTPEFLEINEIDADKASDVDFVNRIITPVVLMQLNLGLSALSLFLFCIKTKIEATVYRENLGELLLTKAKGKFGWIPFQSTFETGKVSNIINFKDMLVSLPFFTSYLGIYHSISFEFDNNTIKDLSGVMRALSERDIEEERPTEEVGNYVMDHHFELKFKLPSDMDGVIFSKAIPNPEKLVNECSAEKEVVSKVLYVKDKKLVMKVSNEAGYTFTSQEDVKPGSVVTFSLKDDNHYYIKIDDQKEQHTN